MVMAAFLVNIHRKNNKETLADEIFIEIWLVIITIYGGYHEMPQKACERCIFHVIAFS